MTEEKKNIIGLFPAGGRATRVSPLPCSKEIYPVVYCPNETGAGIRPKAAGHHLLESMQRAGAEKVYIVLRHGKWDIPAYFSDGSLLGVSLAYLVVESSAGVPHTLDRAYPFLHDATVVFGFPDIVFTPADGFVQLLEKQAETKADLVLGLFPAHQPEKVDMVELDQQGRIVDIIIKPLETGLQHTWLIAAWADSFTQYMHDYMRKGSRHRKPLREVYLGDVIKAAVRNEMPIETVVFEHGSYLDIGTPEDLIRAGQLQGHPPGKEF